MTARLPSLEDVAKSLSIEDWSLPAGLAIHTIDYRDCQKPGKTEGYVYFEGVADGEVEEYEDDDGNVHEEIRRREWGFSVKISEIGWD